MKVPLGRTTLATLATGVLALGLASPPGTASADPDKRPTEYTAEPLAASDLVTAGKSQSSRLAETSPGLLRRDDARPVRVMIKLNYDGAASYPGGIGGLEATSPSVTGRQLTGRSAAETEYADYVNEEEADFRAALAETVPSAEVTGSYQVVYGGVRAVSRPTASSASCRRRRGRGAAERAGTAAHRLQPRVHRRARRSTRSSAPPRTPVQGSSTATSTPASGPSTRRSPTRAT